MIDYKKKYEVLKKEYDWSQGYLKLLRGCFTDLYRWDPKQAKRVDLMFFYLDKAIKKRKK